MKLKERIKNAGFWVSLISSVFLILGAFGIEIGDEVASSIINAVCSLLVVFGIISDPTTGTGYFDKIEDNTLSAVELPAVAAIKAAIDEAAADSSDSGKESKPSGAPSEPTGEDKNKSV